MKSVVMITQVAQKLANGRPVVLCGDLNAEPDSPSIRKLREDWLLHGEESGDWPATWPADAPRERIDYIGIMPRQALPRFAATGTRMEIAASDHRPLVAEIILP